MYCVFIFIFRFENVAIIEPADDVESFWPKPNGWKDRQSHKKLIRAIEVEHFQGDMSFAHEHANERQVHDYYAKKLENIRLERNRQTGKGRITIRVNNMIVFRQFNNMDEAHQASEKNKVTWAIGKVAQLTAENDSVKVHMYGCYHKSKYYTDYKKPIKPLIMKGQGRNAWYENIDIETIFLVGDIHFTAKQKLTDVTIAKIKQHPSSS